MTPSLRPFVAATLLATCSLHATLTSASTTFNPDDLSPFEVVYEVGNNILTAGSAKLALSREGDSWRYELSTRPTGVFKLAGRGRIRESSLIDLAEVDGGVELHPRTYEYRQDEERQRRVDASFDWDTRTLSWERKGKTGTIEFETPLLDRLSVTLAVMNALRSGKVETVEFEIFDNGKLKTMQFVNEGVEILDTSMGKIETIRVRGQNAAGSSRSTRTWFAPSLDFVPIQLEQRKRGDLVARMSLSKLKNRVGEVKLDPAKPD